MKIDELRKSLKEDEKTERQDIIYWMKLLILNIRYLNDKLDKFDKNMEDFSFDSDGCLYITKGEHHV